MEFTTISQALKETKLAYLGNINSSAKLIKNMKVSNNYTYVIYLAPSNQSGYNVCSHSTPECRLGCLATSGHAGMELICGSSRIKNARILKTQMLFENQNFFMNWVVAEMKQYQLKAIRDGYDFSARLNGTSDIDWNNVLLNGKNIFQLFPDVLFYDYSKNINKFANVADNYHLTYSYTGRNWSECEKILKQGLNVAVVFDTKKNAVLPAMYKGYEVVNGDLTDYRPNDGSGVVVGLRWKRIANKIAEKQILNSDFVVKANIQQMILQA